MTAWKHNTHYYDSDEKQEVVILRKTKPDRLNDMWQIVEVKPIKKKFAILTRPAYWTRISKLAEII
jgi:hypothetical protein